MCVCGALVVASAVDVHVCEKRALLSDGSWWRQGAHVDVLPCTSRFLLADFAIVVVVATLPPALPDDDATKYYIYCTCLPVC